MNATAAAVPSAKPPHVPNRTLERIFFAAMSLLFLASVLLGFSKTYFLAGMVAAPLPNKLIHVHGAVFSLWIVFLLVQTALVTTKKIRVHRALGMYGFALAALMVVLGCMAAVDQLHRLPVGPFGMDPKVFFVIPLSGIVMFAGFVFWSYRARFQPAAHKRLIMLSTIVLMDAAIGRWPLAILQTHPPLMGVVELSFVLLLAAYDLVSLRKVHRTTIIGFLIIFVVLFTRIPLAQTRPWLAFAGLFVKH